MQIIIWLLFWLILFFLYENFSEKSEKLEGLEKFKKDVQKYHYLVSKNDYVTTKREGEFFRRLQDFTKEKDVLIFTKVRVGDIIKIWKYKNFTPKTILNRINRSHFDFIAVQKSTLKIICVIELDDSTHSTSQAQERDAVKDFICEFVKIPLIRFKNSNPTDAEFIEKGL